MASSTKEMEIDDERLLQLADKLEAERELAPDAQARLDELSKDLLPGEDLLHYDADRLHPPPQAPASEAQEHVSVVIPITRGPKTREDGRAPASARRARAAAAHQHPEAADAVSNAAQGPARPKRAAALTVDAKPMPFVAATAKQARAVRQRRLRRGVPLLIGIIALLGLGMAGWAVMNRPATESVAGAPSASTQAKPRAAIGAEPVVPEATATAEPVSSGVVVEDEPEPRAVVPTPVPVPKPERPTPKMVPTVTPTAKTLPTTEPSSEPAPTPRPQPTEFLPGTNPGF